MTFPKSDSYFRIYVLFRNAYFPKDCTEKVDDKIISQLLDKLLLGGIRHPYVM